MPVISEAERPGSAEENGNAGSAVKDFYFVKKNEEENIKISDAVWVTTAVYKCVKRLFDICASLAALVILSPFLLVISLIIYAEDGGSVLYVSKRLGRGGKPFNIYKFRSMKAASDRLEDFLTKEELEKYYREYKLEHDPRITRIGGFIRKYSIDELPQLVNILKGDMSFIGPRPILKEELERNYPDTKEELLSIRPGLTGYWQAYGRNNVLYKDGRRQAMELFYVRNCSLLLDARIFVRTVFAVLSTDGAK